MSLAILPPHSDCSWSPFDWERAEERIGREREISGHLKTPVNFIVHTLQEVNDGLAHGRYFFMDVARDGISLYQLDETPLHAPKPKSREAALLMAEEYFEEWFGLAQSAQKGFRFYLSQNEHRDAAFTLHQACERLYHCVLLVCTFYTPHVHNLNFLRNQAEKISGTLASVWPRTTKADRGRFEKLKDAYVKARYSKHYRISMSWLGLPSELRNSVTRFRMFARPA